MYGYYVKIRVDKTRALENPPPKYISAWKMICLGKNWNYVIKLKKIFLAWRFIVEKDITNHNASIKLLPPKIKMSSYILKNSLQSFPIDIPFSVNNMKSYAKL